MATAFLYVDRPVATLQFELETDGEVSLVAGIPKDLSVGPASGGKFMCLIFRMNLDTFSGFFATVSGKVKSVSGVVGANPDATDAGASVVFTNQVDDLKLEI